MGFEELWDGFEKVCKRSNDGEQFVGAILRYFTKRQKLELEYSKALTHLSEGMKDEQEIGTTKELWNALQTETKTMGEDRIKFSDKLMELTNAVANDLRDGKKNRTVLVQRGAKLVGDLAKTEDVMKKARTKYCDARKMQAKSVQAADKAKQGGSSNTAKLQKAAEKEEKKADKSDNEYRISVNNLKAAQDKYYDTDMPALLKDFEAHEKARLEKVKEYIKRFIELWSPVVPDTKASNDRLVAKVDLVNVQSDLNLFVESNRPESDQPPARAQYLSFDGAVVQDVAGSSTAIVPTKPEKKEPKEKKEKPDKFKLGLGVGKKKEGKEEGEDGKKKEKEKGGDSKPPKQDSSKSLTSPKVVESPASHDNHADDDKKPFKTDSPVPPASPGGSTSTVSAGAGTLTNSSAHNPPKSEKADSELVELVTIYAYEATEENELTFAEGETIYLIEKDESGWWRGRNKKGVEGVFPSNFVEVVGEEGGGGASGTIEINADFTALYDYEAEDDTELTIKEGEILHVISETDGWYFGTNAQGKKGNFPSNFVERLEAKA